MAFPGIPEAKPRADLVAYLKTGGDGAQGGTRRGAGRPDLKAAPPEGRVRSIRHCGDTYFVETADGRTEKVWEFNLRFKTDSSRLGPEPGKPVVIGAGMRGDRASVVFASPEEIAAFVRQSCS